MEFCVQFEINNSAIFYIFLNLQHKPAHKQYSLKIFNFAWLINLKGGATTYISKYSNYSVMWDLFVSKVVFLCHLILNRQ